MGALIFVLAYLGGVLTIFSPCVLPVIPFIFSRSDQSFKKSGLPMLLGMGISFASFAVLSIAGGRWVVHANQWGRIFALVVFGILGLSLLLPQVAERLSQPFVRLGGALQKRAESKSGFISSFLLGVSLGLLWAPCAGPILGLVLAGASLGESNQKTFILLLTFALGAATSLSIAIFASGKILKTLKKGFGAEEWVRRALGVVVLAAVAAIALGLDTRILSKLSYFNTNELEQSLVNRASGGNSSVAKSQLLSDEGLMPLFEGASLWLNSPPLTAESLRGKVVLIDFWTYSCINCLRTLPYVKAWADKYRSQGLVVVGVHSPEFAFEKEVDNVKKAVRDLGLTYPIALDNDLKIWSAFKNQYWPAHYFVDGKGHIRHHHFGEGNYEESERVIQSLLKELHGSGEGESSQVPSALVQGSGVEAPPSAQVSSPETYLGYARQQGFASVPDLHEDTIESYREPTSLNLNHWSLSGIWKVSSERAVLQSPPGGLSFRFSARDLHLVIGVPGGVSSSGSQSKAIRFRVTLDGKPPGVDHGEDTDSEGNGIADTHRLYQLIRQKEAVGEHTFKIEFLDSGAEVYAFTFG